MNRKEAFRVIDVRPLIDFIVARVDHVEVLPLREFVIDPCRTLVAVRIGRLVERDSYCVQLIADIRTIA